MVLKCLTHWGRVTHICVSKLTIIGSDNGLSPEWRQAIIWTNAGMLLIGPLGTDFSEILIKIQTFSLNKMHLKMSSRKWRPFCLGLNVLKCLIASNLLWDGPTLDKYTECCIYCSWTMNTMWQIKWNNLPIILLCLRMLNRLNWIYD